MKLIESAKNPSFADAKKLLTGKGIRKNKAFLLSGKKLISEAMANKSVTNAKWWISQEMSLDPNLQNSWPCNVLNKDLFNELDSLGTKSPILQCTLPEISEQVPSPNGACLLLAMGDPGNLGAVIRSAAAFGISKAVLLKESCHPFLPKSTKAAAGNNLNMEFFSGPSIHDLKLAPLVGLDMGGLSLSDGLNKIPKDFYLLAGEEGPGIPKESLDFCLSIATKGVESLNVSVAMSIFLYEYSKLHHA